MSTQRHVTPKRIAAVVTLLALFLVFGLWRVNRQQESDNTPQRARPNYSMPKPGAKLYFKRSNEQWGTVRAIDLNHRFPDGRFGPAVKIQTANDPSIEVWVVPQEVNRIGYTK